MPFCLASSSYAKRAGSLHPPFCSRAQRLVFELADALGSLLAARTEADSSRSHCGPSESLTASNPKSPMPSSILILTHGSNLVAGVVAVGDYGISAGLAGDRGQFDTSHLDRRAWGMRSNSHEGVICNEQLTVTYDNNDCNTLLPLSEPRRQRPPQRRRSRAATAA